ncbi:MAG: efflux RND transporter periplasmic adaptor subunit [Bryobacterales bacterium]|nr:efflux RND transporter periplasmic adaptor subunit [Bryobacterales bacterium]
MPKAALIFCAWGLGAALSCVGPTEGVDGVRPARRDIESALTTNGRIEAERTVAVHSSASGRVGQIYAQRGGQVERDEPLLRLVDAGQGAARDRSAARLAAAKARLVQLEAGLDPLRSSQLRGELTQLEAARSRASEDLESLRRLLARNAVARSEVDAQARALQDLADEIEALSYQLQAPPLKGRRSELGAAILEAEAELHEAERAVEALVLRAPADGTLFSLAVREGDFLEYGSLVARIGTTESVTVRVFVDEPELGRIPQGSVARISADAYPDREWECQVGTLATEVIEVGPRRVGEVLCQADDPENLLLPGLAVRVRIVTQRAERALSVPRAAVMGGGEEPFVWVVEEGRAARRAVALGVVGPVYAEIVSGLAESDSIALPRDRTLSDGQPLHLDQATDD